jgi:hypothetical protein
MSGGYNPKVSNPNMSNSIPQMRSFMNQTPFFFGGAQTPTSLGLREGSFNGSGLGLGMGTIQPFRRDLGINDMMGKDRLGMFVRPVSGGGFGSIGKQGSKVILPSGRGMMGKDGRIDPDFKKKMYSAFF